jgi:hypothetical protein
MRVGIIQSNYLPWRGYFDFINEVDLFIFHDDIQFTKADWRTRNQIKTPQGLRWLSVPVHVRRTAQHICETEIDYSQNWRRDHRNLIAAHLGRAPFVRSALALLEPVYDAKPVTISELNVALIRALGRYLGITTPLRSSAEFGVKGCKTDRVIALLTAVGASTYVSGPAGRSYLDEAQFMDAGIDLEYKSYVYPPYPQLWGPFEGAVSVIDLIANSGPEATTLMRSLGSNELAVPALVPMQMAA